MKELATCFSMINKHTKGMSTVEKGTLFGTTGSQAGQILARNVGELKELTGEIDKAGKKGTYVSQLAKKNSSTAKQAQATFKQLVEAFKMILGTAMLPAR
jgi:phage-related tail protein